MQSCDLCGWHAISPSTDTASTQYVTHLIEDHVADITLDDTPVVDEADADTATDMASDTPRDRSAATDTSDRAAVTAASGRIPVHIDGEWKIVSLATADALQDQLHSVSSTATSASASSSSAAATDSGTNSS